MQLTKTKTLSQKVKIACSIFVLSLFMPNLYANEELEQNDQTQANQNQYKEATESIMNSIGSLVDLVKKDLGLKPKENSEETNENQLSEGDKSAYSKLQSILEKLVSKEGATIDVEVKTPNEKQNETQDNEAIKEQFEFKLPYDEVEKLQEYIKEKTPSKEEVQDYINSLTNKYLEEYKQLMEEHQRKLEQERLNQPPNHNGPIEI